MEGYVKVKLGDNVHEVKPCVVSAFTRLGYEVVKEEKKKPGRPKKD